MSIINNLQLNTCDENLSTTKPLTTAEISQWDENKDNNRWVIASWRYEKEGYQLHFIGDRPLDVRVNWNDFRKLIWRGQKILNGYFNEIDEDD